MQLEDRREAELRARRAVEDSRLRADQALAELGAASERAAELEEELAAAQAGRAIAEAELDARRAWNEADVLDDEREAAMDAMRAAEGSVRRIDQALAARMQDDEDARRIMELEDELEYGSRCCARLQAHSDSHVHASDSRSWLLLAAERECVQRALTELRTARVQTAHLEEDRAALLAEHAQAEAQRLRDAEHAALRVSVLEEELAHTSKTLHDLQVCLGMCAAMRRHE